MGAQLFAPYGAVRHSSGTMPTTYNFTGQRLDSVTGLLYFNARYYDPVSGRFVRADTVQNNAQGMDPYAYVGDSPMGRTDPSGNYYSNGIPTNQQGGETAYIYGNEITTVTNNGSDWGSVYTLDGHYTNTDTGLDINSSTFQQVTQYGDYNPDTDWGNSPWAKFLQVTGWTTLQHSWNAPGASTQSRAQALFQFGETNANNLFQLAAILGGPEDDSLVAADDAVTMSAEDAGSTLYRVLRDDENPAAGLFAKDPGANQTVMNHVLNGSKPGFASQFISTTKSLDVALRWAAKDGSSIAEINASMIDSNMIDISTSEGLAQQGITWPSRAYSYAISSQEVLVEGSISPEAITAIFFP